MRTRSTSIMPAPRPRILWLAFCLCFAFSLEALGSLRIDEFVVDVQIEATGDLLITEQIAVHFLTPHRGIERWVPISGKTRWGTSARLAVTLLSVEKDGAPVPYTSRTRGANLLIRIGDPDVSLVGHHVYTLTYRARRALLFPEDSVRLYWNVTGNDWDIVIEQVTATVRFPDPVDASTLEAVSYVGRLGSTTRGTPVEPLEDGGLQFQTSRLNPGEGLTVDVLIPRAVLPLDPPSTAQRVLWFLTANAPAALPLVTLLVMTVLWWKRGKNPRKRLIAPAFAPPRDIDPGAAGVLIDDRVDLRDITAMLMGLAVNGVLSIREDDEGKYTLLRNQEHRADLTSAEAAMVHAIFGDPPADERTLASLENEFYKSVDTIKSRLYGQMISAGYYETNPERTRRLYRSIGFLLLPLAVFLGVQTLSTVLSVSLAASGLVVLAFSPFMPRKTEAGTRKLEEILGLAEYIRRAEVARMEFHHAPEKSPALFERLLPYAIALNLTSLWTEQFQGLLLKPPDWYVGRAGAPPFHALRFSLLMSGMTRSMQSTFASSPRSTAQSAWRGGGSFGGGASGRGFGGGGGRGW